MRGMRLELNTLLLQAQASTINDQVLGYLEALAGADPQARPKVYWSLPDMPALCKSGCSVQVLVFLPGSKSSRLYYKRLLLLATCQLVQVKPCWVLRCCGGRGSHI